MTQQDNNACNYCTYLSSGLLEAPHEYILPSWPHSGLKLSPILASPYEYASCCHAQPSIWLFIATVQGKHLAPSAIWVASH